MQFVEENFRLCCEGMRAVDVTGGQRLARLLDEFADLGRGFLFLLIQLASDAVQGFLCLLDGGVCLLPYIGWIAGAELTDRRNCRRLPGRSYLRIGVSRLSVLRRFLHWLGRRCDLLVHRLFGNRDHRRGKICRSGLRLGRRSVLNRRRKGLILGDLRLPVKTTGHQQR